MNSGSPYFRSVLTMRSAAILLSLGLVGGCATGTPEQTPEQKEAAIQADPMGYKQQVDPRSMEGGITNTNNFGKDFHDVFDP